MGRFALVVTHYELTRRDHDHINFYPAAQVHGELLRVLNARGRNFAFQINRSLNYFSKGGGSEVQTKSDSSYESFHMAFVPSTEGLGSRRERSWS